MSEHTCACGHPMFGHDDGRGECFTSGCKCRTARSMSENTPTDDQLREIARRATGTGYYSGGVKALRAVWDAARAGVVAEEPEGEHVFIERYGVYHAKFGGIGGGVSSLTLTREAWKALGEADVLAVSVVPVEQEGAE